MLFTETPHERWRSSAFAGSAALHCGVIFLLTLVTVNAPQGRPEVAHLKQHYSVRFMRLQPLPPYRQRIAPDKKEAGAGAAREMAARTAGLEAPVLMPAPASAAGKREASLSGESAANRAPRQFELPPTARVSPVKQTLVQLDVPPNVVLKQDVAIPTALLWTQPTAAPPMRKQFVAPPLKPAAKVTQSLPIAAMLEPPNLETKVADLNMASAVVTDTAHLARPPAMAAPVSSAGVEPAKEVPQIGVAHSSESSPANVISLPASPLRANTMIVLPPANQIAPADVGSGGLPSSQGGSAHDGTQGAGTQGTGLSASGSTAPGSGSGLNGSEGSGSAAGIGAAGNSGSTGGGAASSAGSGGTGLGAGHSSPGSGAGAAGESTGSGGAGGSVPGDVPGATRLTLPKDGRYSVVVVGSAPATPYPESVGALGGKMVYTVYLAIGLHKKWILQYCLPKDAEQRIRARGSATPLEAPFPYLILRPDHLTDSGEDYVVVHGMITSEGRFDQLAMVFPEQLEKKELLMSSLNKWQFRPSSRDGVATTVEVLLIIPREPE